MVGRCGPNTRWMAQTSLEVHQHFPLIFLTHSNSLKMLAQRSTPKPIPFFISSLILLPAYQDSKTGLMLWLRPPNLEPIKLQTNPPCPTYQNRPSPSISRLYGFSSSDSLSLYSSNPKFTVHTWRTMGSTHFPDSGRRESWDGCCRPLPSFNKPSRHKFPFSISSKQRDKETERSVKLKWSAARVDFNGVWIKLSWT